MCQIETRVSCIGCGKSLVVRDRMAGQAGHSPACGGVIKVPATAPDPPTVRRSNLSNRPEQSGGWRIWKPCWANRRRLGRERRLLPAAAQSNGSFRVGNSEGLREAIQEMSDYM